MVMRTGAWWALGFVLSMATLAAQPVKLSVTVFDEKTGELVTGLTAANFAIVDGGTPLRIDKVEWVEGEMLDVMLIFDTSILSDRIKPLVTPMIQGLGEKDQMALVGFDQSATLVADFTSSQEILLDAFAGARYGGNPRALDALYAVIDGGFEGSAGRRTAILLAAGVEGNSRTTPGDVLDLARRRGVTIHTVYWENADGSLFNRLAESAGGAHFYGKRMKLMPKELAAKIWAAARGRYVIEANGVYRLGNRVKVEITGGPKGKIVASVLALE